MSEERDRQEPADDLDDILDDPDLDDPDTTEDPSADDPIEPDREPEGDTQIAQPPSRAQRRIIRQQERIKELEAENRRYQDHVLQRQQQPPAQTQPDPGRQALLDQQERERVALLPLEEQGQYWARKSEERTQQALLRQGLETRDMLDRIQFDNILRDRKLPARYREQVESLLGQARQNGMNPTREWLLNAVVGQEVLSRKDKDVTRQRQAAQGRIANQTVRAGGASRSTAAPASNRRGGNQAAEDDALLRGITVGDFLNATGA